MMQLSSFKAVQGFLLTTKLLLTPKLLWTDFLIPTTLHVQPYIERLLESLQILEHTEKIKLGLHEALINAVKHGNSHDSKKILRVRRILTPKWMIWQIQDEGNGVPLNSRDFSLPSQLDSDNGRGLFLIYQCFDDVRWSRRGNRIQLASRR